MMNNNLDLLIKNTLFLQAQKQQLDLNKQELEEKIKIAKTWLAKKPEYLQFLQLLQRELHKKNIGVFGELLTYFVKDVLNNEKEIVLDLYTYHNLPALKIESKNNGHLENIYEGNGGSIANIVSTGLRLISLSRLSNRKFIILDEPDCWLKPSHIPIFSKIIGEISQKLGIQTVLISHHDWNYFKHYGRVIELKKEGIHLKTQIIHDTSVEKYPENYIKSIKLKQFMSHYDTTYELHPYLTCIVGENDIGKSVIGPAMKAVNYNDSSDSYIQHNTNEAQVIITTNLDEQILWQRFLNTTQDNPQKVKYSLYKKEQLILSEYNAQSIPDFVEETLNIKLTEDLDIHIANQKQPVFLLSSDTKPQERAKILSLGKESLIVQKMMETIKSKTKIFQQQVKDLEIAYHATTRKITLLEHIDKTMIEIESLKERQINIKEKAEFISKLSDINIQLTSYNAFANISFIDNKINIPKIKDTTVLSDMITNYNLNQSISDIKAFIPQNFSYKLNELETLRENINLYQKNSYVVNIKHFNLIDFKYNIVDISILKKILVDFKSYSYIQNFTPILNINIENYKMKEQVLHNAIIAYNEAQNNYNEWQTKSINFFNNKQKLEKEQKEILLILKNKCPTCGQHITKEHIGAIHD